MPPLPLEAGEQCIVRLIGGIMGCLSVFGGLFIVLAFLADPTKLRQGARGSAMLSPERKVLALRDGYLRLLLWLSIADVINSASWALNLGAQGDRQLCLAQGVLMQYGDICSALWSACMGYELYRFVVCLDQDVCGNFSRKRHKVYHVVSWGLPAILACVPLWTSSYGDAGDWCWVREEYTAVRFLINYAPVFVTLVVNIVCYGITARHLHLKLRRSFTKLTAYPVVRMWCVCVCVGLGWTWVMG